jgi:hypothetical protein
MERHPRFPTVQGIRTYILRATVSHIEDRFDRLSPLETVLTWDRVQRATLA